MSIKNIFCSLFVSEGMYDRPRRFLEGNSFVNSNECNIETKKLLLLNKNHYGKRWSKNIKIRIYKTIILLVVLYGCETWSLNIKGRT
jgi:hypothetical protein